MKTIKLSIIVSVIIIFLNSCSTLGEAGKIISNPKGTTTDEFLVKKKSPLIQPPDFESIPEPGTSKGQTDKNTNTIEKIIKSSESQSVDTRIKSSSIEESILNQIKK